jgi:hypothetical protein
VKAAVPFTSGAVPRFAAPSRKVIVPAGVPVEAVMVAVRVRLPPAGGRVGTANEMVVLPSTTMVAGAEALGADVPSPP